jgi:alpha-aminoadipic semialdehyde synthase
VYWDYRYPRILSKENYRNLLLSKPPHQLIEVADISADIRGSIEFTEKYTSIDDPFFLYDPLSDAIHKDMEGKGALVLAVENLPAEFPKDASEHFSSALFPFVESLASLNAADSFESHLSVLPKEMISACITSNGSLLPEFKYIEKLRIQTEREYNSKAAASDTKSNFNQLIRISGHLFDTGLINQVLDSIEESGNQFKLLHLSVSPNDASSQRTSRVVIQVMSNTESSLKACIQKVSTLCQLIPKAQANFSELPYGALLDSTETGSLRASTHLSSGSSPKVLVLGSGMVSRPLLKYLDHHKISTLLVSNDGVQAEKIASSCVNGFVSPKVLDISDSSALSELMKSSDLKVVMSLLPASMHVQVAQKCLEYSKNLVTSSYVSKEMNALNSLAREKNLCFLNEMGLDPGIDHLSAAKIIHESLKSGKKVKSFESFCGGLPAPEVAAENPFMYKFSWSPKGVFSAMQQSALYKKDSKFVNVKGQDLMTSALPFDELRLMNLEHIPNRDSLVYTPQYGLNIDDMDTMYRATLRYKGFCSLMYVFRLLGFLESNSVTSFVSWKQYLSAQHNCSPSNLLEVLSSKIPEESRHAFFSAISWLKVLDEDVPLNGPTTVDAFCSLLQSRLKYEPAERDMIVLVHRFGISSESGDGEIHTSSLVCYGDPIGDSAMARTVGIPAGIGVKLVLEDSISKKGVITPVISSIYDKALPELAQHGIVFHDKVEKL